MLLFLWPPQWYKCNKKLNEYYFLESYFYGFIRRQKLDKSWKNIFDFVKK